MVEVGLGGRLDATNILTGKIACVVTKVDLDHQGFLGNTLGEIAREKAGIATELGVPVVVDGGNHREVVEAVEKVANEASARVVIPQVKVLGSEEGGSAVEITTEAFGKQKFLKMLPGRFQAGNLACAVTALSETVKKGYSSITAESVLHGVAATEWPGRLQTVSVEQITGVPESTVLLDGAHNPGAAKELRNFVGEQESIVWVLAFSRGKDVSEMVGILMKAGDEVVATRFGEVEDMPWVKPVDPDEIVEAVKQKHGVDGNTAGNVTDGVKKSFSLASGRKVVVAGSL